MQTKSAPHEMRMAVRPAPNSTGWSAFPISARLRVQQVHPLSLSAAAETTIASPDQEDAGEVGVARNAGGIAGLRDVRC